MTTYLISGTTKGIGRVLVSTLLLRPNTTVIAGVRDPSAAAAASLHDLPKGQGSKLIIITLNSLSETDSKDAVATLQKDHDIHSLDVVIANAGYVEAHGPIGEVTPDQMRAHFDVNTLGPLLLFQATLFLLQKAKEPKFLVTTSVLGSITIAPQFIAPTAAYGVSKAALNYLMRNASGEYPGVAFVMIHPGLVATDMGNKYVELTGEKAITVEESVEGYVKLLDRPSEEIKGKFLNYTGDELPW